MLRESEACGIEVVDKIASDEGALWVECAITEQLVGAVDTVDDVGGAGGGSGWVVGDVVQSSTGFLTGWTEFVDGVRGQLIKRIEGTDGVE